MRVANWPFLSLKNSLSMFLKIIYNFIHSNTITQKFKFVLQVVPQARNHAWSHPLTMMKIFSGWRFTLMALLFISLCFAFDNYFLILILLRYGTFANHAILDDGVRNITFSYNATASIVSVNVPFFWSSAGTPHSFYFSSPVK